MGYLAPLLSFLVFGLALLLAGLLLRSPWVARHLEPVAGRWATLDGLRGYLALGVFIHHAAIAWHYQHTGQINMPPERFFAQIGQASVALFFMITGFLFWSRLVRQGRAFDWRAFAVSRVMRLYPLYFGLLAAVLVTVFYLQGWKLLDTPTALAQQLSAWLLFHRPDINQLAGTGNLISNVTWTLNYEIYFYLALPLLGLMFVYRGTLLRAVACVVALYLLAKLVGWEHALKKKYLMSFAGGIAAVYWVRSPGLVQWAKGRYGTWMAIGLLVLVMAVLHKTFAVFPLLLLSLVFCIIVSGNDLLGALALRSARWLGEISYSLYLLHGLVLWWLAYRLYPSYGFTYDDPGAFMAVIALACTVLVVLSSATFLLLEKPGIALGKRLAQRPQAKPDNLKSGSTHQA
ncbi:acyltransferase [Pseudomonas fulva]|uniref:acyltransferase family protein n=1 Tax=Pseudomonas fulva TaxID=47880 RepID=UPI0018AB1F5F|nr:acyltransferase [Pseudomonas fulva]MBF8673507.1 acyltransferase [Pseudomonas fulva]MBF8696319.1 acyltransferase [Pseudomonas fulva]